LEEKDILLKEIHHRVKNNLQVVSSLLSLQSRFIRDEQALNAINEGKNRVKSMALIHQNLYQEDNLTGVAIKPYFEKLIRSLFDSYNIDRDRIQLDMQVDNLTLDVDSVIPIGLITNELVSNALKHAFPNSENGLVKVKLKEENNRIVLQVMDNGVGMEKPESAMESNTFGYRIINAFKEKLGAELLIENNGGTNIKIFIAHYQKARKGVLSKVS
jgi:two-component sensor histidine kinase